MRSIMASFLFALVGVAAGCTVHESSPPNDYAVALGARSMLGYHLLANGSSALPAGDIGYLVTGNGQGGYRVAYTDTQGSPAQFSGTISADRGFDLNQIGKLSGYENVSISSDGLTIQFDSVPGAALDGVDVVSLSDPIYLDARVDGVTSGFSIYFTGARSGLLINSAYDPVAFTSP
jgi:hypothetical protein